MESPSTLPALPQQDEHETSILIDIDGPPSSPFVTEVESRSRNVSKQYTSEETGSVEEPIISSGDHSPNKEAMRSMFDTIEDKENVPLDEATVTLKKLFASPQKTQTPERKSVVQETPKTARTQHNVERRGSADSDRMPPPSTARKPHMTPRKTPLQTLPNGANSPRIFSRDEPTERSAFKRPQSAAAFQAGLDTRDTLHRQHPEVAAAAANIDDTCFSTFSEVPEMTIFAKLGQSPTKRSDTSRTPSHRRDEPSTPRTSTSTRKRPSLSRSPSPTPRRQKTPGVPHSDGTTSFLIDFTQQIESIGSTTTTSHRPHTSPAKSATESNLLRYINNQRSPNKPSRQSYATPDKRSSILNLLDFELPPAPTPRSIPTITVRELESLKSSYLSQISSLKATLSGREAEVESLKRAVGDAERRVGEAQETLRDERNRREHVEQEKAGWERRGQEVENVLQNVKEEVMKSEAEKEELLRKLEEGEKRVEDAEARAVKAEERFADALAARASIGEDGNNNTEEQVQRLVAVQIDAKIEAVSRELHAVYKDKHERKVATLKKSYEARSERKCAELQARLTETERANEELLAAKDNTFSGPVPDATILEDAEMKAQLEEQRAAMARLENEMEAYRSQHEQLERELQQERIEKGDLVAAVDEMLALQAESGPTQGAMSVVEDFRKSISRPSGLRAPAASGISRIGGPPGKSRMLANIERMGRTGSGNGVTE